MVYAPEMIKSGIKIEEFLCIYPKSELIVKFRTSISINEKCDLTRRNIF